MEILKISLVKIAKKMKRRMQAKEAKRAKLSKIQNRALKQRENQLLKTKTLKRDNCRDPNL